MQPCPFPSSAFFQVRYAAVAEHRAALAHHDHRIAAAAGWKEGAWRKTAEAAAATAHFPGHSIPKKRRRRLLQRSNLWSPPFLPSFLPSPTPFTWAVQSVSPIPNLSFFWIFQQFQTHILGDFFMKPEMWLAAQTTRQQGGLLLHLLLFPLSRAPRAPFGQVKLRKGGGRRRRNQWHLLSSAWSRRRRRSRPQEAGRIRFLKSAHLKG